MAILETKAFLPNPTTFDEYEAIKQQASLFESIAKEIIDYHQLSDESITLLEGTNIVFSLGDKRVLKLYPPFHHEQFTSEVLVIKHLTKKLPVATPEVEHEGIISGWPYVIMSRLEGVLLEGLWEVIGEDNKSSLIQELGALIREVHSLPIAGLEAIDCHWQLFIAKQQKQCVTQHESTNLAKELISQIPSYLGNAQLFLPVIEKPVLLTGEYTPMNLLVKKKADSWHICGLIDFGDCMLGLPEYDLLGPGAFLIQRNKRLLKDFLLAYGYSEEMLNPSLSRCLTALMLMHRYSNLNVQIRIPSWKSKVNKIEDFEDLVWGFKA